MLRWYQFKKKRKRRYNMNRAEDLINATRNGITRALKDTIDNETHIVTVEDDGLHSELVLNFKDGAELKKITMTLIVEIPD